MRWKFSDYLGEGVFSCVCEVNILNDARMDSSDNAKWSNELLIIIMSF